MKKFRLQAEALVFTCPLSLGAQRAVSSTMKALTPAEAQRTRYWHTTFNKLQHPAVRNFLAYYNLKHTIRSSAHQTACQKGQFEVNKIGIYKIFSKVIYWGMQQKWLYLLPLCYRGKYWGIREKSNQNRRKEVYLQNG